MVDCLLGWCFISQEELILYIILAAVAGLIIGALCGAAFKSGKKEVVYVQPPPQYPPPQQPQHRQPPPQRPPQDQQKQQ